MQGTLLMQFLILLKIESFKVATGYIIIQMRAFALGMILLKKLHQ